MKFRIPKGFRGSTRYTAPTNRIKDLSGPNRARLVGEHLDTTGKIPGIDIRWQEPPNPYITRDSDDNYTWNLGKPLNAGQVCFWLDRQRQPHMYIAREEGVYENGDPKYVWRRVLMGFTTIDARTGQSVNQDSELF